jgi:hypothetical protein
LPLRHLLAPPRYAAVPPAAQFRFGVWLRPCGFRLRLQVMRHTVLSRRRSAPCQPLRCLAGRWLLATRPAAPMGFTLRGFNPVRKALEPHGSSYPACCSFRRPPSIVFTDGLAVNTASSCGDLSRFTHSDSIDGQKRAMKLQLPGFVPPDDPRHTVPSFHSVPRCRPGLCFTCCLKLSIVLTCTDRHS